MALQGALIRGLYSFGPEALVLSPRARPIRLRHNFAVGRPFCRAVRRLARQGLQRIGLGARSRRSDQLSPRGPRPDSIGADNDKTQHRKPASPINSAIPAAASINSRSRCLSSRRLRLECGVICVCCGIGRPQPRHISERVGLVAPVVQLKSGAGSCNGGALLGSGVRPISA